MSNDSDWQKTFRLGMFTQNEHRRYARRANFHFSKWRFLHPKQHFLHCLIMKPVIPVDVKVRQLNIHMSFFFTQISYHILQWSKNYSDPNLHWRKYSLLYRIQNTNIHECERQKIRLPMSPIIRIFPTLRYVGLILLVLQIEQLSYGIPTENVLVI